MFKQILLAGMLAFSAVACGGNECDDAVDKLEECGVTGGNSSGDTDECSGAGECVAKCINDAECSEIKGTDINSDYFKCVTACQ